MDYFGTGVHFFGIAPILQMIQINLLFAGCIRYFRKKFFTVLGSPTTKSQMNEENNINSHM